jgi:hypothetical protein
MGQEFGWTPNCENVGGNEEEAEASAKAAK